MKQKKKFSLLTLFIALCCMAVASAPAYAARTRPVKTAKPAKQRTHSSSYSGHGLAREWEPTYEIKQYKQNYVLLYALSSAPNNLPTSPNPLNQVLVPYALDNRDMKFQISLKLALADYQEYGALWFAYTQVSFWQFYNKANSQPFRETDYSPELIYSLRPFDGSILNFGLQHESNGESNPRSRSWNRVYIQPGVDLFDFDGARLSVIVRWWQRFQESPANDDNPDITDFLGYREVEWRFMQDNGWQIKSLTRSKSIQLDIAAPWTSWLMEPDGDEHPLNIHLQYFSGYGESLLDYNQGHVTWGLGLSLPLE